MIKIMYRLFDTLSGDQTWTTCLNNPLTQFVTEVTNCFNACARNDATSLGQRNTNKATKNRDGLALFFVTLTVAVTLRCFAGDYRVVIRLTGNGVPVAPNLFHVV